MENLTFSHLENPADASSAALRGIATFFYVIDPSVTSFKYIEEIPQFYTQAWPYFLAFILLENVILYLEGRPTIRINDGITSLSHAIVHQCGRLIFRGAESALYIFVYERWRLMDLGWDSAVTWYLAALGVDFCYYWVHRASHEVHILWAQHQVHHSSEEFNLAVGVRQSLLHSWCGFIFYLPLALVIPPTHFLTHQQFSLLFQFWLHTEAVGNLGPLEWIFNTPRHHSVHHGSNIYCLDKNYGGVLIIWDRIFGTFAEARKNEEIIYGLVKHEQSFNPLWLQVFYNAHVVSKVRSMSSWKDKVLSLIKGPSWVPGAPWTGRDEDKLVVTSRAKYDVTLPLWCNVYVLVHFAVVVLAFQELVIRHVGMNQLAVLGFVTYILGSLTVIGMLLENQRYARLLELGRCLALAALVRRGVALPTLLSPGLQLFFAFSAALSFWALQGTEHHHQQHTENNNKKHQ